MAVQIHSFTILFVVGLGFFLIAARTCMRCDDVFLGEQHTEFGVLQNGDPALLSIVLDGKSIYAEDECQHGCPGNNSKKREIEIVSDIAALTRSVSGGLRSDGKGNTRERGKSNGVLAVTVIGSPSLPNGTLTNAFKERLLHGVRTVLLTGSPWLIIPCNDEERSNVEGFFTQLGNPGEALFPEHIVSVLPPTVQPLARQLRDSMAFDESLLRWLRRSHVVRRLEYTPRDETVRKNERGHEGEKKATIMSMKPRGNVESEDVENIASPRLMRYGPHKWIVPAIVWKDNNNNNGEMETSTEVEWALELLQQRILHARAYDERGLTEQQVTERVPWLKRDCFDVVVVSGMYNEVYAKAIFARELHYLWRVPYVTNISRSKHNYHNHQRQNRQDESLVFLAECVHVRVTSADDPIPTWIVPTPLLVSGPSSSSFNPYAGSLARFFGTYSHAIYVNYRRWYNCIHASLVSHGLVSLINEIGVLTGAVISGTLSLQDITHAVFIGG